MHSRRLTFPFLAADLEKSAHGAGQNARHHCYFWGLDHKPPNNVGEGDQETSSFLRICHMGLANSEYLLSFQVWTRNHCWMLRVSAAQLCSALI